MQFKSSVLLISALAFTATSVFAHDYDSNKPVNLTGTVSNIEWQQPYVKVHLNATNTNGATATNGTTADNNNGATNDWEIQTAAPAAMRADGVRRNSINNGDQITVQGIQARDGSNHVLAQSLTLAGGQTIALNQSQSQPSSTAAAQNNGTANGNNLPGTASNLPLIGLVGLLGLGSAAVLSITRRRSLN